MKLGSSFGDFFSNSMVDQKGMFMKTNKGSYRSFSEKMGWLKSFDKAVIHIFLNE